MTVLKGLIIKCTNVLHSGLAADPRALESVMKTGCLAVLFVTILMLCGPAAADDFGWCVSDRQGPAVVVEGKVAEGESFERQIGPNLLFRLAVEPGGWSIVVTEPGKSDNDNYAGV